MADRKVKFGTLELNVSGDKLKVGDKAMDFNATNLDLSNFNFYKDAKFPVILSAVPSLDTSVCELQTFLLNKANKENDYKFNIITISNDLPFAQERFIKEKDSKEMTFLSDYIKREFGNNYGVLIEELKLLNRAIFIIDEDKTIRYVEYLDQNTNLPDIDKAIKAAKEL